MAFDKPIEADRVDDLDLFSVFLRAPVVGTLMWVLGGDRAKKQEEQEKALEGQSHQDTDSAENANIVDCTPTERFFDKRNGLKRTPGLVGSDISDICAYALAAAEEEAAKKTYRQNIINAEPEVADFGLRKAKKMSWSDESGQSLVTYVDESTSTKHEPASSSSMSSSSSKAIKSAMRRSRSVRDVDAMEESKKESLRYLPKGLTGPHNGLIMPTRPYTNDAGVESPQWGWYITTTPPTPDMYRTSHSSAVRTGEASGHHFGLYPAPPNAVYTGQHKTNEVFQGLQASTKAPMGMPNVPL